MVLSVKPKEKRSYAPPEIKITPMTGRNVKCSKATKIRKGVFNEKK